MGIGKNLRLWREHFGMTLEDLNVKTGIAVSTISQIERDIQRPHNSTRKALAEAMGLKAEDLTRPPRQATETADLNEWLSSQNATVEGVPVPEHYKKVILEIARLIKEEGKRQ